MSASEVGCPKATNCPRFSTRGVPLSSLSIFVPFVINIRLTQQLDATWRDLVDGGPREILITYMGFLYSSGISNGEFTTRRKEHPSRVSRSVGLSSTNDSLICSVHGTHLGVRYRRLRARDSLLWGLVWRPKRHLSVGIIF